MKKMLALARMLSFALVLALILPAAARADFADVAKDGKTHEAVAWALAHGIARGTGDGSFAPDAPCTKAALATFLWRMDGAPDMGGGAAWWSDAVAWAVRKGILQSADGVEQPVTGAELAALTKASGVSVDANKAAVTRGEAITTLYAASGVSVRRDIPLDSEEFQTLQHEVFAANQLEPLLKNHKSVIMDLTHEPSLGPKMKNYHYFTKDMFYYETPSSAGLDFDRVFYWLTYAEEGGEGQMSYGLDMCSDYDPMEFAHTLVPEDEEEWKGDGSDTHIACFVEDGLVYLRDRRSAEGSKEWFAVSVPGETYNGEILYSEVIADAKTKELTEFNMYLEGKDGSVRRIMHRTAVYDAPEPTRVTNLRTAFERYSENTVTMTVVVDPGSDHETSRSITIPIGSIFSFRTDNQSRAICFDDAAASKVTHWDGLHSKTFYLFTDPTDEQIERYNTLLQELRAEMAKTAE